MKKKIVITSIVSVLLLAAVIAAGLNAIFTVTHVQADFTVLSPAGEEQAKVLKEKLDAFVGKSSAFLDLEEVRNTVEADPWFSVVSLEKRYPSTVAVSIAERKEVFAVEGEEGYAILSEDGFYLTDRTEASNRSGGENVILRGFRLDLHKGSTVSGDDHALLQSVYGALREELAEVRANVVSILYQRGQMYEPILLQMREGITIEILDPSVLPAEKIRAALSDPVYGYLARSDGERLSGRITVFVSDQGEIGANYDFSRN